VIRRWLAPLAVVALCGCTRAEVAAWASWYQSDPQSALEALQGPSQTMVRSGCDGIFDELVAQGASSGVAQRLAYVIAPRESHCAAQYVHDRDDWSYSRFGLNGLTAGLRANWSRWCGADVRSDTVELATDVRCALAAYDRMGWAPWS
jgi:hypothetical protein